MTIKSLLSALANHKAGQFVTLLVEKTVKGKSGLLYVKQSEIQIQTGISFGSRAPVKQAVALGLREAPELPKWAQLVETDIPAARVIEHISSGARYLCGAPTGNRGKSEWFSADGDSLNYDAIESDLYAKDRRKKGDRPAYLTVPVDNIIEIH